jgi:outer membrane protein assembly factor BamB
MTVLRQALPLALATILLSGCGIFGGDDDEALQPKELSEVRETLPVDRLWSASVGDGSEFLRLALAPAGLGDRIFAASRDGVVTAWDAASGKRLWRTELKTLLSAGPGAGSDTIVVAGSDGDLVALRAEDGTVMWRTDVAREALARPIVADDSVVVYTIDGSLRVLSRFNGDERWSMSEQLPPLTLRGSSSPVVVNRSVIAGFDNGRLIATALLDGAPRWEIVLSPPTGRSDLERLADVDGHIAAVGQDIYATAYQGRMAALAAESGQALWSREISTHVGVSADSDNVYLTADSGEVIALDRTTGGEEWRNDALLRRQPTVPVPFGESVVVGDFEGYVHFFDSTNGTLVARRRVGKGMLSGAPVVHRDRLYVQSESGRHEAFAIDRPEAETAP